MFNDSSSVDCGLFAFKVMDAEPSANPPQNLVGQVPKALVQWDEAAVYADKAYDCDDLRSELTRMGFVDGILRRKKPKQELSKGGLCPQQAMREGSGGEGASLCLVEGAVRCQALSLCGLAYIRMHFGLLPMAHT